MNETKIKIVEPKVKNFCVCPDCGEKQPFKKAKEHWKTVKSPSLDQPLLLRVRMIYSKCLNPNCPRKIFPLPILGIERYQRATTDLIKEGASGIVEDNVTLERIAGRFSRSFNTTGSKSALDRWRHCLADQYEFSDILKKRISFSGALCLDEYMPRRGGRYEQIECDPHPNWYWVNFK